MIPPEAQIVTVILWLILIKFCQITLYPFLKSAVGNLSYGCAYPAGILFLTIISWYLGTLSLPIYLALLPFVILGGYALLKKQYDLSELKSLLSWDAVFLATFLLMLTVRFASPGIIPSGEKFMDAAFLGSIMGTPIVTPVDPWFAGEALSIYYYLGHWMMGVLGVLSGGAPVVVFNLMLPTVFALSAVSAYVLGNLLLKCHRWIPILVLLIPNAALIWHLLMGSEGVSAWWASTRVIGDGTTINEYPLFSYIWGDPHAHLLGSFNQLFFLALLAVMLVRWKTLSQTGRYLLCLLLALSLGSMPGINSWDVMIYAPVYLVIAFLVWYRDEGHRFSLDSVLPFVLVPVLSIALYSPFLYTMLSTGGSSVQGFFFVTTPSAVNEFLGVYLFFVGIFVLSCLSVLKKYPWLIALPILCAVFGYGALGIGLFCILLLAGKRSGSPEILFGILGMAIVVIMEIVYLKDYMGDTYYRMNTVFKFGFCAWFLLGISVLVITGRWIETKISELPKKQTWALAVIVFAGLMVATSVVGVNLGYSGGTLDGSAWLEEMHPADSAGISWLMDTAVPGDVVVEAADSSYTYSGRVSAMTGLSTIVGWVGHEAGWRQGVSDITGRWNDVRLIYEDPSMTLELMEKYGATYLFVGELEEEKYQINLPTIGLTEVFASDGVSIYKLVQV